MGLLSRIFRPSAVRAAEGEYRDGPYALSSGWLPAGSAWNFWQMGRNVQPYGQTSAMVQACVSGYAQTVAMCPGDHWRKLENGGRERVGPAQSALARILRRPNDYQTISDFLLNLTHSLYGPAGNAYALALRNDRNEISELHLMDPGASRPRISEGGELFYQLGGNEIIERRFDPGSLIVPARDVLHVRCETRPGKILGLSPVVAAALDMAAADALTRQQIAFFTNQARPSFILSNDEKLTAEQTQQAREYWESLTSGRNAGKTPIMAWGWKAQQIGGTAQDAQLAETLKMTDEHVALAFRVPQQILGIGGTPFASTEALMQSWRATGLGFALNHIEEAFGQLFRLKGYPEEYLELNTDALLRSAHKDRIEALARGVQGGIYSPDEARALEDLPSVEGGHGSMPRVQQQVVPLDWHENQPAPQPTPIAPPPDDDGETDEDADERSSPDEIVQRLYDYAGPLH